MKAAVIISASSDVGFALCEKWSARGVAIYGTYRTHSHKVGLLRTRGIKLVHCDLAKRESILDACSALRDICPQWDALVSCAGLLDPIGPFISSVFDLWEESVMVNFVSQLRIVRELLPTRRVNRALEPIVLLFAGGGPNKATTNYSAYAVSKIALIKICELLDAELLDTRFVIVNPGWVTTKIHGSTFKAGERSSGDTYRETIDKLASDECTPMDRILECCDWLIRAPRNLVSGRYFGVMFDAWGTGQFEEMLAENPNKCKLRRYE